MTRQVSRRVGDTLTSTSPEGRATTAVVDSVGRVLTQVVPGIDTVFFGYDTFGHLESEPRLQPTSKHRYEIILYWSDEDQA